MPSAASIGKDDQRDAFSNAHVDEVGIGSSERPPQTCARRSGDTVGEAHGCGGALVVTGTHHPGVNRDIAVDRERFAKSELGDIESRLLGIDPAEAHEPIDRLRNADGREGNPLGRLDQILDLRCGSLVAEKREDSARVEDDHLLSSAVSASASASRIASESAIRSRYLPRRAPTG